MSGAPNVKFSAYTERKENMEEEKNDFITRRTRNALEKYTKRRINRYCKRCVFYLTVKEFKVCVAKEKVLGMVKPFVPQIFCNNFVAYRWWNDKDD